MKRVSNAQRSPQYVSGFLYQLILDADLSISLFKELAQVQCYLQSLQLF